MLKNSRAFFYILAATLFILISDGLTMRYKVLFGGDEIISFLCATGNADEYEAVLHKYTPYGKLTDAVDWLKYTEITEPNCFNKIGKDLCSNDLHPPLYFWLLHIFVLKLGVHIYTGILLNLLLQLFSLFFIFKLASLIFEDQKKGAFAALIWSISPACMMVSMNARPYELLELVSIIYLLNFYLWQKKATKLNAFLLAMIGTLGLLTNYTFIYFIASCGLFTLIKYKKIGWRNISAFAVAAFISFELMTIIHPCFADSFALQQIRAQSFSINELPMRMLKSGLSFMEFLIPVLSLKQPGFNLSSHKIELFLVIIIGLVELVPFFWILAKKTLNNGTKTNRLFFDENLKMIFTLFIILSCTILIPYLFFITPFHAMGGQYLVFLYPLMAILFSAALYSFSKKLQLLFPGILFAGSICVLMIMIWWNQHSYIHLINQVQQSKVIVINDLDRRSFPRLIPYLKPGQQILMDENISIENDSMIKTNFIQRPILFISGNKKITGKEINETKYHSTYDANDGVVFYCKLFE